MGGGTMRGCRVEGGLVDLHLQDLVGCGLIWLGTDTGLAA